MTADEYRYESPCNPSVKNGERLYAAVLGALKGSGARRVCDLGCGNGYFAGRLAAAGYDVTGLDASASGIDQARQHFKQARFVRADLGGESAASLGKGSFDAVVSVEVLEHLYRPADLVECAAALLREGGVLVLTTPYHGYWKYLALALTGSMDRHLNPLWDGGHVKFFSARTLTKLVEKGGFRVERLATSGRIRPFAKSFVCVARRLP